MKTTTRKAKTRAAGKPKATTRRQTRYQSDDAAATLDRPTQERPVSLCGSHVPGEECRICGFGMDVCTFCGVQNVAKATGVCASCGKTAARLGRPHGIS